MMLFCFCSLMMKAQERTDHRVMNYLINPKPNSIIYNDTLYKGSNQFKYLFYRTADLQLIHLYQKHQSNKIIGNIIGIAGALAIGFGVGYATNPGDQKTTGWVLAGSGLACSVAGAYLMQAGQRNLMQAVEIFNSKYNKTSAGIGFSGNRAGLVVNF